MAKMVEVPLYSDYHYEYPIALEGKSYILEFVYVERLELYTMSIFTSGKVPLITGVGVVPGHKIINNYAITGLSGYFYMLTKSSSGQESYKEYPEKISEYYRMAYIY